ncbi:MAG: hypothetical protein ACYCT7_03760 [bacterium]
MKFLSDISRFRRNDFERIDLSFHPLYAVILKESRQCFIAVGI